MSEIAQIKIAIWVKEGILNDLKIIQKRIGETIFGDDLTEPFDWLRALVYAEDLLEFNLDDYKSLQDKSSKLFIKVFGTQNVNDEIFRKIKEWSRKRLLVHPPESDEWYKLVDRLQDIIEKIDLELVKIPPNTPGLKDILRGDQHWRDAINYYITRQNLQISCSVCKNPGMGICSHCGLRVYCGVECQRKDLRHSENPCKIFGPK